MKKYISFFLFLVSFVAVILLAQADDWGSGCKSTLKGQNLSCPDDDQTVIIVNAAVRGSGSAGNHKGNPAVICSKPGGSALPGLLLGQCYYFWLNDSSVGHLVIPWNTITEIKSLQDHIKNFADSGSCKAAENADFRSDGAVELVGGQCAVKPLAPVITSIPKRVNKPVYNIDRCMFDLGWISGEGAGGIGSDGGDCRWFDRGEKFSLTSGNGLNLVSSLPNCNKDGLIANILISRSYATASIHMSEFQGMDSVTYRRYECTTPY